MNVENKYRCKRCGEIHDYHSDAELCCKPEFEKVYICGECGREYDFYSEAEDCCEKDEESGDDECVCTHDRSDHSDGGECQAFINKFIGDCPCSNFELV